MCIRDRLYVVLLNMCLINISLAIFNLMPFPPFDGSRIYSAFLPQRLYFGVMRYEKYILIAVLALLWLGVLDGPLGFLNHALFSGLDAVTGWVDLLLSLIHIFSRCLRATPPRTSRRSWTAA